jgi:hypothetical protein
MSLVRGPVTGKYGLFSDLQEQATRECGCEPYKENGAGTLGLKDEGKLEIFTKCSREKKIPLIRKNDGLSIDELLPPRQTDYPVHIFTLMM